MVFSSITFILKFLPIFLIIFYVAPHRFKNLVLLLGSLFFYAYGEPRFVVLLMASVLFNYVTAKALDSLYTSDTKGIKRKIIFILGIFVDIIMLAAFKLLPESIGLPLGISFYTFQSMSYLIDVYKREIEAEKSIIDLGAYICMFPQLVAGPIVMYSEVRENLKSPKVSLADFDLGLKDFTIGLAMKVLIADRLSILWNEISKIGYVSISTPLAWMGAVSYSLQIYFDFFGYSVMAIGLGKMLGFSFPENFIHPYTSGSIREFYRRWHVTLGRWFKKYVYIPLGGGRGKTGLVIRNLFVVWLLTALWHGVGINFLLWGLILWLFIVVERLISTSESKNIIKTICSHLYVIFVIVISWVCFAISDEKQLWLYLGRMFGFVEGVAVSKAVFINKLSNFGPTIMIAIILSTGWAHEYYRRIRDSFLGMLVLAALFWTSIWYIQMNGDNPFMYFRF